MTPLITGIYSKFVALPANNLYTALSGRLYHAEAPQSATFPYATVFTVSSEHDWTFTDTFEDVLIQFNIFTNERSAANAGTFWKYLIALYDDTPISITGYSQIDMIRGQSRLVRDEENNVWQYMVEYECTLEQS